MHFSGVTTDQQYRMYLGEIDNAITGVSNSRGDEGTVLGTGKIYQTGTFCEW